jgi:hypothetical protein
MSDLMMIMNHLEIGYFLNNCINLKIKKISDNLWDINFEIFNMGISNIYNFNGGKSFSGEWSFQGGMCNKNN